MTLSLSIAECGLIVSALQKNLPNYDSYCLATDIIGAVRDKSIFLGVYPQVFDAWVNEFNISTALIAEPV